MSRPLRVFLCHASQDKPAVWKLYRYLKQHGVQPWLDKEDLLPGQDWRVEIPKAIDSSDVIVVCLSKNSVNKEGYVQAEITFALDKALEKPEGTIFIVPVKLEECDIPNRLARYQWVDLSRVDGRKRLLLSLIKRATDIGPDVSSINLRDVRQKKTVSKLEASNAVSHELVNDNVIEAVKKEEKEYIDSEFVADGKNQNEQMAAFEKIKLDNGERGKKLVKQTNLGTHIFNSISLNLFSTKFGSAIFLGIGGISILIIIFIGFGLINYYINNFPIKTLLKEHTPTPTSLLSSPTISSGTLLSTVAPSMTLLPKTTSTPKLKPGTILYYAQDGDTLSSLAKRFDVTEDEITSQIQLPEKMLIDSGTMLIIPDHIEEAVTPDELVLPDNEIIFSSNSMDFYIPDYISKCGGYLSTYNEYLGSTGWVKGHEIIRRLEYENSINPKLLLAVLEYESHWVRGQPVDALHAEYAMGYENINYRTVYMQLAWAIEQLSAGYYGWRDGSITELTFADGTHLRINPRLNAGTVAVQYLFSRLHSRSEWDAIMNHDTGFLSVYKDMFDDPWQNNKDSIFIHGLTQPEMVLPFEAGVKWFYMRGPHGILEHNSALAAIDFAPATAKSGCTPTEVWVTASAPGLVVRSEKGIVVVDLDGDTHEQTGWNLVYFYIGTIDRIRVGEWVDVNDKIGHPSCEGDNSSDVHLQIARKYNGEWIPAGGPIPLVLDGWSVVAGEKPDDGWLISGDKTITADPFGQIWSVIFRDSDLTPTKAVP